MTARDALELGQAAWTIVRILAPIVAPLVAPLLPDWLALGSS